MEADIDSVFSCGKGLISVFLDHGGYCYKFAGEETRGPFFDEVEAYHELINELSRYLGHALHDLEIYDNRLKEIRKLCYHFDTDESQNVTFQ